MKLCIAVEIFIQSKKVTSISTASLYRRAIRMNMEVSINTDSAYTIANILL